MLTGLGVTPGMRAGKSRLQAARAWMGGYSAAVPSQT
jgi:hypothetical protein